MTGRRFLGGALVALALALASCEPIDDGGGGGGGGGVPFTKGFAFIRSDDVWVADASDYTKPTRLTTSGNNRHPALGKKLVAFVHVDAGGNQVQTVPTDASAAAHVVYTADVAQKNLRTPTLSPDGTVIVFAYDRGSTAYLGRVNADGTGFRELTPSTGSYASPVFLASGTHVVALFGNSSTRFTQVQKVDASTGASQSLLTSIDTSAESIANRAVLSPDGNTVAYDARLNANPAVVRIFVQPVTGFSHRLTEYTGDPAAVDGFPTWVDNTHLGFTSNTGGADQVYVLDPTLSQTSGGLQVPSAAQPWYGP